MLLAAANENPLDALSRIQAPLLFQGLPRVLDGYAWIFVTIGFILLVTGHNWRLFEAGNDGHSITRAWYKTLLILAFMLLSPKLCQFAYEGVDSVVASSGLGTPVGVTRKCIKLAMSTPELESVFSRFSNNAQAPSLGKINDVQNAIREGGLWGYTKAFWFALGDEASDLTHGAKKAFEVLTDGPAMIASFVMSFIKAVAIFLSSVFMFLFLLFAGLVAYALDSIRYFLLVIGSLLLPTFIAGYSTRSFCNQGHKYVTSMISLMLWPIWWMLGHIGTVGLFNAYVSLLSGTSIVASAANKNFTNMFSWEHIDSTVSGLSMASFAGGGLMATGASTSFLYLGLVVLGAFGLFLWVLLVTVGGPFLGHKLVATSASFYGSSDAASSHAKLEASHVGAMQALRQSGDIAVRAGRVSGEPAGAGSEALLASAATAVTSSSGARAAAASATMQLKLKQGAGGTEEAMVQTAKSAAANLQSSFGSGLPAVDDDIGARVGIENYMDGVRSPRAH
jgi:ABC-type multidrug transport system fused ATPase/permease subunit